MKPGQYERLGQLLVEMEEKAGPIPADLLDEAGRLWRPRDCHDDAFWRPR
jgi:hypothetical protein